MGRSRHTLLLSAFGVLAAFIAQKAYSRAVTPNQMGLNPDDEFSKPYMTPASTAADGTAAAPFPLQATHPLTAVDLFGGHTGIVVQASVRNPDSLDTTEDSRSIEIVPPDDTKQSTLTTELRKDLMNEEILNAVDNRVRNRIGNVPIQAGFYFRDTGSYLVDKDGRSTRPFANGLTPQQDIDMRHDMAVEMKSYMINKGALQFISQRLGSQNLEQTLNNIKNATTFNFSSGPGPAPVASAPNATPAAGSAAGGKPVANATPATRPANPASIWHYGVGVDPYKDGKSSAFSKANNDRWNIEARQNLRQANDSSVKVTRTFDYMKAKEINSETEFLFAPKVFHPKVTRAFSKRLNGGVEWSCPVAMPTPLVQSVSSVTMSYSF